MKNMFLSIIIPCHNEEQNIKIIYSELLNVLKTLPLKEVEFIFVNDGSSDTTQTVIEELHERDNRVRLISFMTNYGKCNALLTGLRHCNGDIAISIDADMQHPPSYLPIMIDVFNESAVHIVDAKRQGKQQGFLKNILSQLYYKVFNLLTGVKLEPGVSDFRLYDRIAINALINLKESQPFIRGLIADMKFSKKVIYYEVGKRNAGTPSYTLKTLFQLAYNSLLRFSQLPYRFGFLLAFIFVFISFFMGIFYLYNRFFTNEYIPGNTDIIIILCGGIGSILLICSIILRQIGILTDLSRGKPIIIDKIL